MDQKTQHRHILISLKVFASEMLDLVKSPVFIVLTLLGNFIIIIMSAIFYLLEININPNLHHFLDAIWWGFSTATTTGYGDIIPHTHIGKLIGIMLMLLGTAIFAMFTALFAETILNSTRLSKLEIND